MVKRDVFIGPRPFGTAERGMLFGRDSEARDLISLIVAHRSVVLHSPAGAGKTSFLNALVIPQLKKQFQVLPPARVRLPTHELAQDAIQNIYMFNALAGWCPEGQDLNALASVTFGEFLSNLERALDENGEPLPLTIIFDQFEELFTSYPDRWMDRKGFFEQIGSILERERLRIVFSIREDYLGGLERYLPLLPDKVPTFRVERLRERAALAAIEGPLRDTDVRFAPGVALQLVNNLLQIPVKTERGTKLVTGEFVEPVQLQVACQLLWGRLERSPERVITHEHLQAFGDVDQALRSFYEKSIQQVVGLTRIKEGRLRRLIENALFTPAGTRAIVFRGRENTGGIPNAAMDELDKQHIIRSELRGGERWYELSHDRFIRPIQESNQLWLNNLSRTAAKHAQLEEKASQWKSHDRDRTKLLYGTELAAAEQWLKSNEAAELGYSDAVLALVQTSALVTQLKRHQRVSRLVMLAIILLVLIIGLITFGLAQHRHIQRLEQLLKQNNITASATSISPGLGF